MEKKNMVLLTVIAVATLLVAVVGATFAYFTASTKTTGSVSADITTNKLDGANVTFASTGSQLELLDYPGGLAVYGANATIAKQEMSDTNNYQATFNLKINYTNQTGTDLNWELYMVKSKYEGLDAVKETICKLQKKQEETEMQFWYSDESDNGEQNNTSCTGSGIINALTSLSATKIASGKLKANQENKDITKDTISNPEISDGTQDDSGNLENRTINTEDATTKYYYLIVKYPNTGKDQSSTDEKKQITVKLSIDGQAQLSLYKGE